jgi:hypothetical protein
LSTADKLIIAGVVTVPVGLAIICAIAPEPDRIVGAVPNYNMGHLDLPYGRSRRRIDYGWNIDAEKSELVRTHPVQDSSPVSGFISEVLMLQFLRP